ncbi:MAG: NUDIX domain-containing protein [Balneolaceae bacterium]
MTKTPETTAIPVQAAGGLVPKPGDTITNPGLLLIHRNGVWDLPKGKLEDDESIPACAVREVMEEVGLDSPPGIISNIGPTYHSYEREGKTYNKETFWFVMKLADEPDEFTPQKKEGITRVEWVPAQKAYQIVGYENLRTVIKRFLDNIENLEML